MKIISKLAQKKKAAEAWAPGMVTTDVGGINEKSLISCFFKGKDMSDLAVWKRQKFVRIYI